MARARRRRPRRADGCASRPGGIRRPAGQSPCDLGRVPGSGTLRPRRGGIRCRDDDRARCRPGARAQGGRAGPRRGHGGGRQAGGCVMYALYTAVALIGLVTFWLPLALLRRFTRGVPLNVRARLGWAAPIGGGRPPPPLHPGSLGGGVAAAPPLGGPRRPPPPPPPGLKTGTQN